MRRKENESTQWRSVKRLELYPALKLKAEWGSIAGSGPNINHLCISGWNRGRREKKERSAIAQLVLHPSSVWTGCQLDPGNICWLIFRNRAEDAEWCRMTKAAFMLSVCLRALTVEPSGRCRCAAVLQVSGSTNKDEVNKGIAGHRGEYTVVSRAPADAANELSFGSNVCHKQPVSPGWLSRNVTPPQTTAERTPAPAFSRHPPTIFHYKCTRKRKKKRKRKTQHNILRHRWRTPGVVTGIGGFGFCWERRWSALPSPARTDAHAAHFTNTILICSPISKWRRGNKSVWRVP